MKTRLQRVFALFGFVVSLFLSLETYAQSPNGVVRCFTDQADSILHAEHPELESSEQFENWLQNEIAYRQSHKIIGGVYQIPVVFHVIHSGQAVGTGSNLSYATIMSQMDVFNEDFRRIFGSNGYNTNPVGADTEIEFCMAQRRPDGSAFPAGENGVNRINYTAIGATAPPFTQAYVEGTIKAYTYNGNVPTATRGWDPAKYLNIWLCDIGGGLLGYAQFPTSPLGGMSCGAQAAGTDGVVFLYSSVGKSSVTGFPGPYNEGRTATHEVGHWLGLRHIWGDGNCTATDYCNDTPPANAPNYGCPTGINTCTAAPDQGPDMIENYMDYTDDACMNVFTNDQKQRMRAVLEGSPLRVSLINSDACTPPNPSDASVTDVFAPTGDNCVGTITPSVQLRNRGANTLTSATISYKIDNGAATTFAWSGSLAAGASTTVALPGFSSTLGQHTFKAYSTVPNGVADPFPGSDTSSIVFMVSNGIMPNYTQDFEASSFPPDNRWNIVNGGNTCFRWTPASGVSSTGVLTNNIAQMPCFGNSNTADIDDFYTPIFLVPCNATSLTFKFDVAYRKRVAGSNDRLQVDISTDCGATWTNIYNKSGNTAAPNDLAANATLLATEYFPTVATDWRTETLNLMSYVSATSDQVRFRFRGTSNNGNNIFIDNVKFEGTTPGEINVLQTSTDILDGGYSTVPSTQVGNTTNVTYTVQNTGTTNLVLTNPITVTGTGLALVSGFGATTIAPGGSTTFTISYTPAAVGSTVGNISFVTNDCDEGTFNFALNCTGTQNPPVANFTANPLSSCAGTTVTFTNTSTNATSYSWNFGPNATPTTSTATNPTVTFLAGTHTITLTATNAFGSDIETKTNYITALAPGGGVLPIVEGFVTATTIPTNWSLINTNSSATTWARATTAGIAPTAGNCMRFDNYNFNDGDDDQLRVQGFSLNGYTSATMTFDVSYRTYSATFIDGLEVLVSTDCGQTFTSVYNKSGATLATVAGNQTSGFVPTTAQWRNETVSLTPYINNPNVIVAFKNLSGNGQFLYIDNVNISGVLATATANFTMAPNPVCQGQTVTFTNTSTGATSYSWNFGAGATPATASTVGPHTVTYSSPGTKTVTLQINGTGPTSTQNLTVNALPATPTITAGGPTTFCAGGSVTLTSSAGTTYQWLLNGTNISGATASTYVATASGTYTVIITNASGCQSAASAGTVVTVNPAPATPTVTVGGPTTFCAGGSVTLTSSAGTTYQWLLNGTNISGATASTYAATASGTYSVIITNASGCQSAASAGTVVTVNPAPATPTVTAGGPTTFCSGGSVTLTSSAGTTYQWLLNGTNISGATSSTYAATASGTYTVIITNASGCQSSASAGTVVTVNPAPATPTVTAGGPTTFCSGGSVTLTSSAGTTYQWLLNGTNISGATASTYAATASGTYTVIITNASGCQSAASAGTVVTVNALPTTPTVTAGGPTTFCAGGSVTLTSSAGTTYQWRLNGTNISGATASTYAATASGTYTVIITNASGCQSAASAGTVITVNALPTTPTVTAGSATTFCTGGSVTLTSSAGTTYQWLLNGTNISGATASTYAATTSGTYTVIITNASGCPSTASAGTVVTVNALPTTPTVTAGGPTTFCTGGSVTLTSSAGTTYQWRLNGTNISGATASTYAATASGTYTVIITNASGCQSAASAGTVVTVNPTPVIALGTLTNPTSCTLNNGSIQVTGSGTGNLSWTGAASGSMTGITLPTTITGLGGGAYNITFTSAAGCVSNTLNGSLSAPSAPSAPTITAGGPTTFCAGGSVTLTASAGTTYLWSTGATTSSITVSTAGSYTVTITNASGCTSLSSAATVVTVNSLPATPTITAGGPTTFCSGGSVTLTASAGSSYLWSTGATTASINVTTAGTYTVQVTNASGCQSAASAGTTVTVNSLPATPTITAGGPTTFCAGGSVTLTASAGSSYLWSTGATTASINVTTAGTYTVQVANASGCQSAASAGTVVTVNSTPVIALGTLSNPTSCTLNNGSIQVTGSGTGNLSWTGAASGSLTGVTLPTSITGLGDGAYNITFTSAAGCVSNTLNGSLTAPAAPSAPTITAGGPTTFCAGGSVTLTSTTGSSYLWSTGETTQSITVSTSGTYSLTINNASGCTSPSSAGTIVTVNALPATPTITAGGPTTFCAGGSVTLTASTGTSYLWSTGETTQSITVSTSGTYSVQVTNASGCQSAASTGIVVTVDPLPITPTITASGATTFCSGGSVTLTASTGTTYLWSTGETTQSITVSTSGNYSVQVTNASGCQSAASSVTTVTVNPTPSISVNGSTNPTACGATDGSITILSTEPGDLSWTGTASGSLTNPTFPATVNGLGAGSYTFTVTTASGCISNTTISNLSDPGAPATPIISASGSLTFCDGGSVDLTSSSASSYTWSTSETTQTITVTTSGTYTVTVSVAGCSSTSAPVTVVVHTKPVVTLVLEQDSTCLTSPTVVLNGGLPAGGTYSGAGVVSGTFDPSIAGLGTHLITYDLVDGNGCSGSASQNIVVTDCSSITENSIEVALYPNPTSGIFTIASSEQIEEIEVIDNFGRIVLKNKPTNATATIDLSVFADAVYTVKIKTSNSISTQKLTLKK